MASTTEKELRQHRDTFAQRKKAFTELKTTPLTARIEHEKFADAIAAALTTNESRRAAVALALTQDKEIAADCPDLASEQRPPSEAIFLAFQNER